MKAKLRLPDKYVGMNRTEKEWALQLEASSRNMTRLDDRMPNEPYVLRWRFEPLTFRLAKGTTYKPDFYVLFSDGHVEMHEVKAVHGGKKGESRSGWKATASVKFKTSADLYTEFEWVACEKQRDGSWAQTRAEDLFKRSKP